jgi:hypothetical protein
MKLLVKLVAALSAAFAYGAVATVAAQAALLSLLWSDGALTPQKIRKYAAIMYGFDLATTPLEDGTPTAERPAERKRTREEILAERVQASAVLSTRQEAVGISTMDIHGLVQQLSTKRERYEIVKQGFDDLLEQLENDVRTTAIQRVQATLEILQPKQSKDLMMAMLEDQSVAGDDVLGDVLSIIRGLPQDKVKKIFGEFKTEAERAELHRILVALGELDNE